MTHVIYVSGPIRDERGPWYVELNCRRADELAYDLWRRGFAAICPHSNTRNMDGVDVSPTQFIDGDLAIVERCDAVVVVPERQGLTRVGDSEGTRREVEHAMKRNIPVVFASANRDATVRDLKSSIANARRCEPATPRLYEPATEDAAG